MKKTLRLFLIEAILIFLMMSCSIKTNTLYLLYHPKYGILHIGAQLYLSKDSMFYYCPPGDVGKWPETKGKWIVKKDTLILNSEYDEKFIKIVDVKYSKSDTSKYSVINVIYFENSSIAYTMEVYITSNNESLKDTLINLLDAIPCFYPPHNLKVIKNNNYNSCQIISCNGIGKSESFAIELKDTIKIIIDYPAYYHYYTFFKDEKYLINKINGSLTPITKPNHLQYRPCK